MGWTKHKLNHPRHPQATQKDAFCYNGHLLRRSSCYLWFLVWVMGKTYKCSAGTQSLWVSLASVCWTSSILLSHGGSCRRRMSVAWNSGRAGYFVTQLKNRSVSSGSGQVVSKETLVLEAFCKQVLLFIVARQQLLAVGKLDNSSPGRRGAVEFTDLEILGKSMSRLPLSWELNRFVLPICFGFLSTSSCEWIWFSTPQSQTVSSGQFRWRTLMPWRHLAAKFISLQKGRTWLALIQADGTEQIVGAGSCCECYLFCLWQVAE